ncbi:MAG: glutamine--fructose-6-phosphate transaminase (isomerizing) [Archaeoglobus sp.]|nr:glutamine--fructose-6-phosphate transaminase (isomerizing) [Archaeoglobus sp.]
MCGIVGYIGFRQGDKVVVSSLKRLEYRGYDSWGYAVANGKELEINKKVGSISALEVEERKVSGITVSIGHTRWATHGKPSDINAHPHTDCDEDIAVVHNGIITNFSSLKNELMAEGHIFRSETDTEVIPHLIEKFYRETKSFEGAVFRAVEVLRGSYAFVAMKKDERKLVACKYKSPLILGVGDGELILASDVPAILEYTNRVIYLNDGDIVIAEPDSFKIFNEGKEVEREIELIHWSIEDAEKGGYEHFMLKEINENPRVIEDTIAEYVSDDIDLDPSFAAGISEIVIVACGTSYHAGLIGKYVIEKLAGIPVRVEYASEYNYHSILPGRVLVLGITQSGETADTLEALRAAKRMGLRTCSIVNVVGSSATKISDHVLFTRAGPEICVAATKSFIAQLVVLYIIAIKLSPLTRQEKKELVEELKALPEKVQRILDKQGEIEEIAKKLSEFENMMYIGRGIGFPTALEGALKMKEISYIHAEGYPAGELKHGPFALLGEKTPVIAVINRDETYEIMLNNLKEVKARESLVVAVSDEKDEEVDNFVDFAIKTPETFPILAPILHSIALQLLAYFAAKVRGCEIDKPRNLAKSVTVE